MPGFLSHYIAGKDALQEASPEIKKIIAANERLYNLGTQGPDIFFYYFPGQLRKRSRGIGREMHLGGLGIFLGFMASVAKSSAPDKRDTIFSYIAGYVMHYALDCHAHPYVYAMIFDENAPKLKTSAAHRKLEMAIDIEMLKLVSGKKPSGVKQWELINAEKNALLVSAVALSLGILKVYKREIPPKTILRAMEYTINFTRFLQSKGGKRKRLVELAEKISIREPLFSSMIHEQEVLAGQDYLNLKKNSWNAPWEEENEFHNCSFPERYAAAVEEGSQMLEALHSYVYGDLPLHILKEKFGNRSLKTGEQGGEKCTA